MYPAKNGDAFLVCGNDPTDTAILIDGGFGETFHSSVKPDLQALSAAGKRLDLVIASHIDSDHVAGLLEFLVCNGNASTPSLVEVGAVWHNSIRGISADLRVSAEGDDLSILKALVRKGFSRNRQTHSVNEISAKQGTSLGAVLLAGDYHWNESCGSTCIAVDKMPNTNSIARAQVEVLGPSSERLSQLSDWWKAELRKLGFTGAISGGGFFDDAFEFLCSNDSLRKHMATGPKQISALKSEQLADIYVPDKSVTNASSIVVCIVLDGKSMLFLGDSLAEDMVTKLRPRSKDGQRVWFDLIKLSHHGSHHNTSPELLGLIDSDTFLVSTNGHHGHPDFSVLKAIVDRPATYRRSLHFSYSTSASRQLKSYRSTSGAEFTVHENSTDWLTLS